MNAVDKFGYWKTAEFIGRKRMSGKDSFHFLSFWNENLPLTAAFRSLLRVYTAFCLKRLKQTFPLAGKDLGIKLSFILFRLRSFAFQTQSLCAGPVNRSFTDCGNSSLHKKLYVTFPSDTIGRAFRKSKTTLDRAPMVPEYDHLRLPLSLHSKLTLIWKTGTP